ncbi:MAG: hypothetical protein AAAC47_21120, partial [Pararhizobium sp.]
MKLSDWVDFVVCCGVCRNMYAITGTYKKSDFFEKSLLTSEVGGDYKPLTNEGGGAAGDRRTR